MNTCSFTLRTGDISIFHLCLQSNVYTMSSMFTLCFYVCTLVLGFLLLLVSRRATKQVLLYNYNDNKVSYLPEFKVYCILCVESEIRKAM